MQEVLFQKIIHKKDSIERPELGKLNGLTSINLPSILAPETIIDSDETLLFEWENEKMEIIVHDYTDEKLAALSAQDSLTVSCMRQKRSYKRILHSSVHWL